MSRGDSDEYEFRTYLKTDSDTAVRPSRVPASILSLLCVPVCLWLAAAPAAGQAPEPRRGEHVQEHAPHPESPERRLHKDARRHDARALEPGASPGVPAEAHGEAGSGHPGSRGQDVARVHASEDRGHHDEHGHAREEPTEVRLSPEQLQTLGIVTAPLERRSLGESLRAPGEVRLNSYATARVTPRIEAQVTARHARLGDRVEAGQPLVTLSSVEMAVAQGDLVVAEREWQRLTKLGDRFVSDSSYLEASVARQKARSRASAFGMTRTQIEHLVQSELAKGGFDPHNH